MYNTKKQPPSDEPLGSNRKEQKSTIFHNTKDL